MTSSMQTTPRLAEWPIAPETGAPGGGADEGMPLAHGLELTAITSDHPTGRQLILGARTVVIASTHDLMMQPESLAQIGPILAVHGITSDTSPSHRES
jgi:hypothetical protein